MGPPITLFLTTIASQVELRRRQEYLLRIFQVKQIPFNAYDMASDENARKLWKRKVPVDKQTLPGLLVDNTFVGTVDEFEQAVEQGDPAIRKFLRMDEEYNADVDRWWATPAPDVVPIGVPGVQRPSEISGHQTVWHGPKDKPIDRSKVVKHDAKLAEGEIDLTETLGEFGLEGVIVTADELAELVAGLGLGDKQASALVKGIADASAAANPPQSPAPEKEKEETKKEPEKVPEKKEPVRTPSKIPTPTIKTPPATRPIVKVDTETTPAPSEATLVASPMQVPPSPNLLSPLASREVMSELAKRVRSRTDALPRRMSSMSPSPISTPILESTIPEDSVPPIPEEKTLPKRTRKASTIESAKPKVAFPSTPGGEDPPELPKVSPSASVPPSPAQRERRISNMGGRSPAVASPPSAFPASPARSRKTSSTGGPPSAFPASSSSDAISSQGTTPARQRKTSAAFGAAKPKLPSSGSNTPSKS